MAIKNCSECGQEVSTKAKKCPHCGAPVKQKTSLFTWLVTILLGLVLVSLFAKSPNRPTVTVTPWEIAMEAIEVGFTWKSSVGGNIMEANFVVNNKGKRAVKDVKITCDLYAKSGTRIDKNTRTLYDVFKAGAKKTVRDVNMGFIHSQAQSARCKVVDLVVM